MQSFKIIKPIPILSSYIRHYWIYEDDAICTVSERTLPIGCIQLVFHKGKRLLALKEKTLQPSSFICGQNTEFSDVQSTGNIEMITVVFQPHAAKAFFKIPIHLFQKQNIAVDDIKDAELSLLSRQIADSPKHESCIQLIEDFLLHRLITLPEYNLERVSAALQQINNHVRTNIPQLADTACLSNRQFSRIFTEYVGSSPKEFMRIIRLQKALFLMQRNPAMPFIQLAYECGFSDQSHMIKEFKLYSGYTPMEYLTICAPYSDYFSNL